MPKGWLTMEVGAAIGWDLLAAEFVLGSAYRNYPFFIECFCGSMVY